MDVQPGLSLKGITQIDGVWEKGPEGKEGTVTGGWRRCIMRGSVICTVRQILLGLPKLGGWDGRGM